MRAKSVLIGRDNEAISILLDIHCNVSDPSILDCTYNTGKMWKGSSYKPFRMDINSDLDLDIVGDFKKMPFGDRHFDVIVFDPPHLPTNAASENSSCIWKSVYGITSEGFGRDGDNVIGMFDPFLMEAKRVLREDGIILAKLADLVHNHRYQWQQVEFVNSVRKMKMTACDMMIKCDPSAGNLQSSKWKNVKHLRKAHSYWIVVRNSSKCECKKSKSSHG
jgi:SAM-dependent methyltransferase